MTWRQCRILSAEGAVGQLVEIPQSAAKGIRGENGVDTALPRQTRQIDAGNRSAVASPRGITEGALFPAWPVAD